MIYRKMAIVYGYAQPDISGTYGQVHIYYILVYNTYITKLKLYQNRVEPNFLA